MSSASTFGKIKDTSHTNPTNPSTGENNYENCRRYYFVFSSDLKHFQYPFVLFVVVFAVVVVVDEMIERHQSSNFTDFPAE